MSATGDKSRRQNIRITGSLTKATTYAINAGVILWTFIDTATDLL